MYLAGHLHFMSAAFGLGNRKLEACKQKPTVGLYWSSLQQAAGCK